MIRILAVLCSLLHPDICMQREVTNSDLSEGLSMSACLVGMPALADYMRQFPGYRLQSWKCRIGQGGGGESAT